MSGAASKHFGKTVPLGSVVAINPNKVDRDFPYNEIDYIDISSVGSGDLLQTTRYLLKEAPGRAKRLVADGDTILSTVRPNRRSFLFVKDPKPWLVVSTGFAVLRPSSMLDSRFLYYTVTAQEFTDYLALRAKGAAYPAVDSETIANAEISLPGLGTQRKIAAILSTYDELIQNNTGRIKILDELAHLVYNEWFVKFRLPGCEKTERVESELGPIPNGWQVVRVEDIVKRVSAGKRYEDKTASSNGSVPILDQGKSGIIGYHDDKPGVVASENKPVIVFANHTCYQRIIQFPFSAIQNVLPFLPHPERTRDIYWLHWATKDLVKFNDYKGHWPEFMSKQLLFPPADICSAFGRIVKPLVQHSFKLERKNVNLRATRDLLLSKLISGEIDVENLDIVIPETMPLDEAAALTPTV